jgi:uncharacterized protein YjbI with pentapeptide repeats
MFAETVVSVRLRWGSRTANQRMHPIGLSPAHIAQKSRPGDFIIQGRLCFWPTVNRCAIMLNSTGNNQEATMKRTALLRVVVVLLVLIGLGVALLQWAVSGIDDLKGLALNLGTEMIGAAMTYVLIELVLRRREESEAKEKEREAKRADLIAQMGSGVKDVAVAATEELDRHSWLRDGSLRGAYLRMANLEGANLYMADLQEADLMMANLQGAYLANAFLQKATLSGANLQTANLTSAYLQRASLFRADLREASLYWANLQGAYLEGANLEGAHFSEGTRLPDGTNWTPDTDMARFTDPDHPDFWRPDA